MRWFIDTDDRSVWYFDRQQPELLQGANRLPLLEGIELTAEHFDGLDGRLAIFPKL